MSRRVWTAAAIAAITLVTFACRNSSVKAPKVEGHYTYQHGWNYDINEGHIEVNETGTMDFDSDGTALDSARQVYVVTLKEGGKLTWVFNYISPSLWRAEKGEDGALEGGDFYFSGVKDRFRMEMIDSEAEGCEDQPELAERIVKSVSGGIDRETKFHLAKLTDSLLMWSYTYPDGHTDTWEFTKPVN